MLSKKHRKWTDRNGIDHETDQFFISEFDLVTRLRQINDPCFRALKSQVASRVIHKLYMNYKAFYSSIKEYKRNPKRFNGRPRIPGYRHRDDRFLLVFSNQCSFVDKGGHLKISRDITLRSVETRLTPKTFQEVRIVPIVNGFKIEIAHNKKEGEYILAAKHRNRKLHSAAIDIGVDNLATVTSDDTGCIPMIINGRPLKSINQFYHDRLSKIQSTYTKPGINNGRKYKMLTQRRNNMVYDYIHKASRRVTDWCVTHDIHTLFIGYIKDWKNECSMGRVNNQKFVSIPFLKFITKLEYKLSQVGIRVRVIDESYTSKCSFLDNESIGKHQRYLGKRSKRGLFESSRGCYINADVNGSLNILRRGTGTDVVIRNPFNPIKTRNINEIRDDVLIRHPVDRCSSVGANEYCHS